MRVSLRLAILVCVTCLCASVAPVGAQSLSKWYLAEGATGTFFEENILIANPNTSSADITITYLRPGGGTPVTSTFTMGPTSRKTVKVNAVVGVENAPELSAVVECTNGLPIIVERSPKARRACSTTSSSSRTRARHRRQTSR